MSAPALVVFASPALALALAVAVAVAAGGVHVPAVGAAPPPASTPVATTGAPPAAPVAPATLAAAGERLAQLADSLHVPGMVYAIVRGDEVLVGAHGVRDVASGAAMETSTLLPLGSATRSFTAALAAMLVDDGTVWWDQPLTRTVPRFTMVESTAAVQCSLRDLLCHRSGLMRSDLLWLGGAPTEAVAKGFMGAKPTAPFRERFQDESTGYVLAGLALANAARSTERPIVDRLATPLEWDALLRARLLEPLGMTATRLAPTSADEAPPPAGGSTASPVAVGYVLEGPPAAPSRRAVAPRPTVTAAPAVGLASTAEDLARFLQLFVGRGRLGDQRLISTERVEELWRPQIAATPGASANVAVGAGLGWDLLAWNGERLVRHEGGAEGFRVSMAILPERRIGLLLATNAAAPGLARRAEQVVFSMLLGRPAPLAREPSEVEAAAVVGRYRSAMLGSEFDVRLIDGTLQIEVSDGGLFDLEPPGPDGARQVVGIPDVAAQFPIDPDGARRRMLLVQSGMRFDCGRLGAAPETVDPAVSAEAAGLYLDPALGANVAIMAAPGGRLALESKGRPGADGSAARALPLEFEPTGQRDRWILAGPAGMALEAVRGDDGRIRGMTLMQPMAPAGGRTELLRIGSLSGPAAGVLPQPAEFLARHRAAQGFAALTAPRTLPGTIAFEHQGVGGTLETRLAADGAESVAEFAPYGHLRLSARSAAAAPPSIDASFDGPRALAPREAEQLRMLFGLLPPTAWIDDPAALVPAGVEGPSESPGLRFLVRTPAGAEALLVIDADSGLARRLETELSLGALGTAPMLVTYEGWRMVDGVALPSRVLLDGRLLGRVELRVGEPSSADRQR